MEFTTFDKILSIETGKLDANAMEDHGIYPFFTCSRQIYQINSYAFDCEAVLLAGNNASGDFNVKYYNGKFNAYQRTYVISKKSNYIDLKFVKYKLDNYLIDLKKMSVGANTKFLKLGMIKNIEIPIPPLQEQQAIVSKLDQAFAAIDQAKANIEKNIANAKELFQSKLNQIFSEKDEGWEERKLGEVVQFTNGRNQKEVLDVNGEYPILGSAGNIMGYATNFLCEKGTVIIGRKGNISKPLFIDFKFWNVDTAFGLFPKNKIMLPKFNYYVCLNIDFASHNKGTTIPSLVKSDLIEIKVSYPISLEIQQQILDQLDQLQEQTNLLVTKYQQKLANLEELKKSILEKAFKGELL